MNIRELDKIEKQAALARFTNAELYAAAGVSRSTVFRARRKGAVTVKLIRRLEEGLADLKSKSAA